jgi:beta-phosphoglucomutase family hydrolase
MTTAADRASPVMGGGIAAVIFDMDGVVTDTARLHAAAWKTLFDTALEQLDAAATPFDAEADYHTYIDGRSREDGVRAFLASRNLSLPEGSADDPPSTLTVSRLAARKQQLFTDQVAAHGVTAYPSTVALLHQLRVKAIAAGLVTASRNGATILAAAGVTELFAAVVDGNDVARLGLAGKPSPDMYAEAARRLGVPPGQAVVIEDAEAGVRAGVAGRFGRVIGIDRGGNAARLRAAGADIVVADLLGVDVTAPLMDAHRGRPSGP